MGAVKGSRWACKAPEGERRCSITFPGADPTHRRLYGCGYAPPADPPAPSPSVPESGRADDEWSMADALISAVNRATHGHVFLDGEEADMVLRLMAPAPSPSVPESGPYTDPNEDPTLRVMASEYAIAEGVRKARAAAVPESGRVDPLEMPNARAVIEWWLADEFGSLADAVEAECLLQHPPEAAAQGVLAGLRELVKMQEFEDDGRPVRQCELCPAWSGSPDDCGGCHLIPDPPAPSLPDRGDRLDEATAWVRELRETASGDTQHDVGFRTACGEIAIHLALLAASPATGERETGR